MNAVEKVWLGFLIRLNPRLKDYQEAVSIHFREQQCWIILLQDHPCSVENKRKYLYQEFFFNCFYSYKKVSGLQNSIGPQWLL